MNRFHELTATGWGRRLDSWGYGHFGADRGNHSHEGVDFVATPGEQILSPIDGTITRIARPYEGDPRYEGLVITGTGAWAGVQVKLFYVEGEKLGTVKAGERIGTAQNLGHKYPGMTNYIHIEVHQAMHSLPPDDAVQPRF